MNFKDMLNKIGQLSEAVKDTATGRVHTADAGGYGRKEDEDDEGNKVKAAATQRGRGRPKKNADAETGQEKTYDTKSLNSAMGGGEKPKKEIGKVSAKNKLKEYFDQLEQILSEGETIEKQGGRVHKGTYGTSHEAGDDVKKAEIVRGRGRPKKDADETGEVKNYDFSAFGAKKGVKLPAWDKNKTTKHNIKEADQIQIRPANQVPKAPGQSNNTARPAVPGQPQQNTAQNQQQQKNTQVITQGNKTLGTVDNPQLAQQIKQSIGKGEMSLMPGQSMEEGFGDVVNKVGTAVKSAGNKVLDTIGHGSDEDLIRDLQRKAGVPVTGKLPNKGKGVAEGAKPDFLDVDKDGNKKETFKKAVKDKKKVAEGMDQRLQAARLEGKAHGLKGHAHCGKNYEDMEESRSYHDGYKEGLDESYGQDDNMSMNDPFSRNAVESTDFYESLNSQLNALLEGQSINEGLTISVTKGQEDLPDTVSVVAQSETADQLLAVLKNAGLGVFDSDNTEAEQSNYGGMDDSTYDTDSIEVVDDHDGMMNLMKTLSGQENNDTTDYENEEGGEESSEGHHHDEDTHGDDEMCESCGSELHEGECMTEQETDDQMTATVAEEAVEESYANSTDDGFDADIEYMMNAISGGPNNKKSTGQATTPVLASQTNRLNVRESINDWKKLAGLK